MVLARRLDGIESRAPLLPAQGRELLDARALAGVIAEDRDVDVLGEPGDQPERFRERRPALEQQPQAARRGTVEECIEGPADPEILLDVLRGGAHPPRGAEEGVMAILGCRCEKDRECGISSARPGLALGTFF